MGGAGRAARPAAEGATTGGKCSVPRARALKPTPARLLAAPSGVLGLLPVPPPVAGSAAVGFMAGVTPSLLNPTASLDLNRTRSV